MGQDKTSGESIEELWKEAEYIERKFERPESRRLLMNRIKYLLKHNVFTQKQFAAASNRRVSTSRLSEILKSKLSEDSIKPDDFYGWYDFLKNKEQLIGQDDKHGVEEIGDNLYFSLLDFMQSRKISEADTESRMPGVYILYRPSFLVKGQVTVSLAVIEADAETDAMTFTEHCRIPERTSIHTSVQRELTFSGYLVRKRRKYYSIQMDSGTGFPRTSIFAEVYGEKGKAVQLAGASMGLIGPNVYTSKMYLERIAIESDFSINEYAKREVEIETTSGGKKSVRVMNFHAFEDIPEIAQSYITKDDGFNILSL